MFWKLFLTAVALASLGIAQDMGGMSGGSRGGMGSAGSEQDRVPSGQVGRVQKETKADMMVSRLKLNKDQTAELITILTATQKDATPVIQQLLEARQRYATALIDGKNEADIAPLLQAMQEAQFQMTGVEVKAFQRILATLKPNQAAKAPEAFDLMGDIFMPTSMPGGGGRRGGGRDGGGRDGGGR